VAEEQVPGVVITVAEEVAAAPSPRLPHPGGPSAVIPLTTTLYDRSLRYREVAKASDRGAMSAIEVALTKTRIRTPSRFPVRTAASKENNSPARPDCRHPYSGVGIASALSTAEIVLTKTRLEGAALPVKFKPAHSPDGVIRTRARTVLEKTRVRPATSFPVPAGRQTSSSVTSATTATTAGTKGGPKVPGQGSSGPAPSRTFPSGKSRSLAARRANAGGSGTLWSGPATPARSSRAAQASRAADSRPGARPVNRRPSGRP
jgi:hypothetical protein